MISTEIKIHKIGECRMGWLCVCMCFCVVVWFVYVFICVCLCVHVVCVHPRLWDHCGRETRNSVRDTILDDYKVSLSSVLSRAAVQIYFEWMQ